MAKSDTCASAPTNATPSTGRTRTTSSGTSRTQRASSASRRSRRITGMVSSMRSAAAVVVVAGQRMPDGGGRITVVLEPGAGPPVQLGDPTRLLPEQLRAEHVGEQVVVAVPLPVVVERDEEQVGPLERDQPRRPPGLAGDGIAQRAGEPLEDGRLQQEVAHVGGLAREDLLGEVVHDEAVVAGEPGDDRAGVVAVLQGQAGQLQGGRPSLGPLGQGGDVSGGQRQAHRPGEILGGFLRGEPQVGRADLDQLAARPKPRERQRRVGPGSEQEMDLGRQMLEQERHPVVDVARLDQVVVVQHQHDLARQRVQVVHEADEDRLGRRLRRPEQAERAGPGTIGSALQGT